MERDMAIKKTPKKVVKNVSKKIIVKAQKMKVVKKASAVASSKPVRTSKTSGINVIDQPFDRARTIRYLAETSGLQKKDVLMMIDALNDLIAAHLRKRGPGEFTLLGLAKFRVIHKPAVKARHGINPFTGKAAVFAAKPARQVVKVRPLKKIKEMAV